VARPDTFVEILQRHVTFQSPNDLTIHQSDDRLLNQPTSDDGSMIDSTVMNLLYAMDSTGGC
jgi:hypothetical protein